MEKPTRNRLFIIAAALLLVAGAVFLGISIFGDNQTTTPLAIALGCILLANLLNLIRLLIGKDK